MTPLKEPQKRDRVPIFLRIRPDSVGGRVIEATDDGHLRIEGGLENSYRPGTFRYVFKEDASQEEVYRTAMLPLLESVVQKDKNALFLAYGASGSGKTHTVSGARESPGLLSMSMAFLFDHVETHADLINYAPKSFDEVSCDPRVNRSAETTSSGVWISVIQVYNDALTDLLNETALSPLSISQDNHGRCFARDVTWRSAPTQEEAFGIVREARKRQKVASTKLNQSSSRSHFVVSVKLIRIAPEGVRVNQVVIVDLAGTERQTATEGSGTILRQAGFINSSLLVLRRCIDALRKGHQQIPFRDSKLTRLLSPFLTSAQTRLAMIVCINAGKDRLSDSLSSIKFAVTATDLSHPQEVVKRSRETRRESGDLRTLKNPQEKKETIEVPETIYKQMRDDLLAAEKLAVENEDLRRRLQLIEESAENAKLIYMDKISALHREQRAAMKALREEQETLRSSIQRELLDENEEMTEENKKHKEQGHTMAALIRERLHPEVELFRLRYGHLEEFPALAREDMGAFEPTDEEIEECIRCRSLEESLRERSHKPRSGDLHATSGDSGNETASSRENAIGFDDELSSRLQEEKQQLHENLVQNMRLLDHKDFELAATEARIRDLEEKYEEAQSELQDLQVLLKREEIARKQLEHRVQATPCRLGCDRCRRASRLGEIPRTAPDRRRIISPSMVRESAKSFTPVFCGPSGRKKDLPRRRLKGDSSSDDD